jgi:predicted AlkP superfamily phosphohydrolase/phosphomutase
LRTIIPIRDEETTLGGRSATEGREADVTGVEDTAARAGPESNPLVRILFLAVDAGDKDLILDWAREGILPTFRSLLETSVWGSTQNPVGFYVGSVWPSFWTGLSPAEHGRYCFSQLRTGTYDHYDVSPRDTRGEPFWDALCANGCRVAILDVPKTVPSPRINGIHVVDWGTHDPELDFRTSPESLASEIEARFGTHPVDRCDRFVQRSNSDITSLRDALVTGVHRKADLAAHFLQRGGWDLFLTVFAESHCVGHHGWHLHDPKHPRHDPNLARRVGDPIRDVYVAIDGALGRLIALAGPETTVFVLASHGMGPHYDGTFLLEKMLRSLLELPAAPRSKRTIARFLESAWHRLPSSLRLRLRLLRGRTKHILGVAASAPELADRLCFATPNNDVYGGIRVNLVGREPKGRIRPGAEYDAFCEALTKDLLAFVNLDTGKPLVKQVLRTADLYQGEHVRDLPDLLVEWERDTPISRIQSPKAGVIEGAFPGRRTGDHKPEGLLFARGPGVAPRRLDQPIEITQLAPTIASLLGVRLPRTDAEPVAELTASGRPSAVS